MLPYVFLILIPLVFSLVTVDKGRIYICGDSDTREKNLALPVFFLMLFFILALRHETVGNDLLNYKYYFQIHSNSALKDLMSYETESLFKVFNWLIGRITDNYQWYLTIVAAVCLIPIAKVYCEDRTHSYLKIIVFVNMSVFVMLFSGIRQSIAMAVGMVAYMFVRKKKLVAFILAVIVAIGIHHSAIMLAVMYPAYYMVLRKKHFYIIIPTIVITYVFNQQIFTFITSALSSYTDAYEAEIAGTGAFGSLILFVLFAIFSHVVPDESKMDQDMLGLRNYMFVAVVIQCFAPLHMLAMRMNYYFILFIPLLLSKVLKVPKEDYSQVAITAETVMNIFFTVYFLMTTYNSYVTGISALNTVPYVPFWRGY